ncbi:MAG: hypothetical protein UV79_C0013G0008 [candidate division TM6 bacterium GW2011_GWF2_43_17]|nr:MAG: hypothetical protein UV79_C0013G0008 [candidate division TM6 bacterium GW2011_GWF2_43_17]HAU30460.1 hypothetical protein [Candidatus Dependentiae bacterium]
MKHPSWLILILFFLVPYTYAENPSDEELKNTIQSHFPEIVFEQNTRHAGDLSALLPIHNEGITLPLNRFILGILYNIILDKNPNKHKTARVRYFGKNHSICSEEKAFWEKRDQYAAQALEKVLNRPINTKTTPRIALISSGGGFRAMISFAGFANKLNQFGILDAVHMIGGVSGSTWLIYPWMASKKSFTEFYPEFVERVLNGILGVEAKEFAHNITTFSGSIAEAFLRRLAFHEIPTSIDLYGLMLGLHLFDTKSKKNYAWTSLSSIKPHVTSGTVPLPIGTAIVQHEGQKSDEVEFNPFEVINYGLDAGCPGFGFGRDFYNGKSLSRHPAPALGYLMGICGSAFSQKVKTYIPTIKDFLKPKPFFVPLFDLIEKSCLGESRLFPAFVRNYTRGMNASPDKRARFHAYIDAGIDYDAPMLPTLNPERNIDIIILVESGSNVNWSGSLEVLARVAKANNRPFPHIDYERARSNPFSVFDDGPDSPAPIVFYVPLVKNPSYSEEFDPWPLIYPYQNNFLHMMNFFYTREQYNLLAGLFETAASQMYQNLTQKLLEAIDKKERGIRPQNG